ncbi:hypothetical protein, partial [Bifidobacterium pseudolongum]|uniref:hypothetical protein n=1 Tax=Bifidobacterium pseudolongum TaxID=1694 RepID=UPI001A90D3B7
IQPQQALTIEHAKIRDRPCPILFIIHTTNDGARPLHTKKGRARIVLAGDDRDPIKPDMCFGDTTDSCDLKFHTDHSTVSRR